MVRKAFRAVSVRRIKRASQGDLANHVDKVFAILIPGVPRHPLVDEHKETA